MVLIAKNGVIASTEQPTLLIDWHIYCGLDEQSTHTKSAIKRWPHIKEDIDDYMRITGPLPGDLQLIKLADNKTVVVVYHSGIIDFKWVERAIGNNVGVAIAAYPKVWEWATEYDDYGPRILEIWS